MPTNYVWLSKSDCKGGACSVVPGYLLPLYNCHCLVPAGGYVGCCCIAEMTHREELDKEQRSKKTGWNPSLYLSSQYDYNSKFFFISQIPCTLFSGYLHPNNIHEKGFPDLLSRQWNLAQQIKYLCFWVHTAPKNDRHHWFFLCSHSLYSYLLLTYLFVLSMEIRNLIYFIQKNCAECNIGRQKKCHWC